MLVPLFVVLVPCVIAVSQPAQITGHADQTAKYLPNWSSLDSRPLPEWYDQAKIGIFIHWGVFSVPSFGSEWFWYNWKGEQRPAFVEFMQKSYPPNFTYQDFGPDFTAEFFDPNKWADLFEKSGARYVVLTSKHHDGYTLWPSKYSFGWNTLSVGPNRDLVGAFADAIRNRTQLHFGLYHSLYEWFNPLYLNDKATNFSTNPFVTSKTMPELHELVELYSPEVIWSDGEWEAPSEYWTSKEFLAWLYNESPVRDTIVVNDRWGQDSLCKHGGYYTCVDRFNPGVLQAHKWENAMTIDKSSWGFRRDASLSDFLSIEELIKELISTVSCGGNILINVGPSKEGVITPIYEERLTQMGNWLNVYGEAVYNSTPWIYQNDTVTSDVWFTQRVDLQAVYATFLNWPKDGVLLLAYEPSTFSNSTVIELMTAGKLNWSVQDKVVHLVLPNQIEAFSHWGWVLKLTTL